ncbi:TPA: MerR family DNA-binding transcriptional regulator, partial [Clostridioides difficile]|nr:MerR family DNA-binding transcriptional regulator [Clostridioides difficile]
MKDYYKIGEISKIYGIGRDSLMYYEEIGILRPVRDIN